MYALRAMQQQAPGRYSPAITVITALFVTVLIPANIIAVKLIEVGGLVLNSAIVIFPISYIVSDVLTEVYGYKRSRRVIWAGFACLALSAIIFWIVRLMPGEATWQGYAGDSAYNAILGGMSSGGIVLASLAGYWTGEFTNSFILAKMKVLTNGRWLWMRTIGSTIFHTTKALGVQPFGRPAAGPRRRGACAAPTAASGKRKDMRRRRRV